MTASDDHALLDLVAVRSRLEVLAGDAPERPALARRFTMLRNAFIARNYKLLIYWAREFIREDGFLSLDDLVSEAAIGAMHALDRYDPTRGPILPWVHLWVRRGMLAAVRDQADTMRRPQDVHGMASKTARANARMASSEGRSLTDAELAKHLKVSLRALRRHQQGAHAPVVECLDAEQIDGRTLAETIDSGVPTPEAILLRDEERQHLSMIGLLKLLPSREQTVLVARYVDDLGYEAIGLRIGRSRECARQLHISALQTLRRHLKKNDGVYTHGH